MRTTVTLDTDTEQMIRWLMQTQEISFKQAINNAIRQGCAPPAPETEFRTKTFSMGRPTINLDRALQVAAELEDEELIRKMRRGS